MARSLGDLGDLGEEAPDADGALRNGLAKNSFSMCNRASSGPAIGGSGPDNSEGPTWAMLAFLSQLRAAS